MNLRDREWLVFTVATAVALVHALDDAVLNRQPGVPIGEHALAALVSAAAGLAAIAAFPRLRPGVRATIAFAFGVFAGANGGQHVAHVAADGPSESDLTGLVATAAGIVLVGLSLWIPFRHRGERAATRRRRWANRVIAALALAGLVYYFVMPVAFAMVVTHKYREPIGAPPSGPYREVTFRASDGLRLSGWYVPSRNRAAVIVVHGGGGDRTGGVDHARLLARHGYGVLLYDSRGRGESEGSPNALGWEWPRDVAGAVEFLRDRPEIDPERLGGLGLSTGADVLIEFVAEGGDLKAVVSDGATGRSVEDQLNAEGFNEAVPYFFTLISAVRVITSSSPDEPLKELVSDVSPTPLLLIAAGRGVRGERAFNRVYFEAARDPVELWDLPDVNHTAAIRERPQEYERRVVGLFERSLLGR
ncbi:MAG: alpha/beta hydrolase [Actinomycetota bacterium]|nr:alpha/beta hydrolase [Actinomycetota bacterium]